MSAFPRDHLNGRPKLLFCNYKKDTCSLITGKINQNISQLLSVRPGLPRRESSTTVFKPTFLVRGFSAFSAGITAESGQGRETPNMRNFYN
jgi:hypothetical protein